MQGLLDPVISKVALMGLRGREVGNSSSNHQQHQHNPGGQTPIIILLQRLITEAWSGNANSNKAISPRGIVSNIRRISKTFRHMRQEDAHECFTEILSKVHDELLAVHKTKLSDPKSETTFISRCYGGTLASEVQCPKCKYISQNKSYTHDLSIDVTSTSLSQCIQHFFKTETLKKGNE